MQAVRSGLLAAALATAVIIPLAAVPARAQDQLKDQSTEQAKEQSAVAAQDQGKDDTKVPAQGQAKDETKGQPANQAKDQPAVETKQPAQIVAQNCPGNPDALGTSRVLPVDFSQYQQLGRMQYPDSLPLNDKEVVITFDDGPLPPHTDQILDILAAQCVKATFFMVGEMARAFPATVRRVYEEGHTIGTHSDHHPVGIGRLPLDRMRAEIDGGIADVSGAFGGDPKYLAPFFRIPGLDRSDVIESELAQRGLIIFSSDVVADDWHRGIKPDQIISLAISRLEARGKGILLLHDIHPKTVAALPGLLAQLKEHGFHVVQVVPSDAYLIAMARKPETRMLASAMPHELSIDATDASHPAWPQAADNRTPDEAVLPVPAAAAFEPDTGLNVDRSAVQWPVPDLPVAAPEPVRTAHHGTRAGKSHERRIAKSSNKSRDKAAEHRIAHVASSSEHEKVRPEHHPAHLRGHAKSGASGNRADLVSKLKSVAALFSPAQSAR
jgi:peptidoglycan/xylan/chitin deacetylase (PgdA/CDA1 family)